MCYGRSVEYSGTTEEEGPGRPHGEGVFCGGAIGKDEWSGSPGSRDSVHRGKSINSHFPH